MSELQQIIYRLKMNMSIRSIHKELGAHRTIIRSLKKTAEELGWLKPESSLPEEEAIQAAIASKTGKKTHPLDILKIDIEQWLEKGISYTVMHRLVLEKVPCSYTTLRNFIHENFPTTVQPIMLRQHIPGEVADVDFGFAGLCYDPEQKRNRKAWFFSLRLRYSRKAYRVVVYDQKESTFFTCHMQAFEYFGGVPEKICTDNLKAAVIRACWNNPLINKSYRRLAEHYSFIISPCKPYTPRHKGGVENDVKYVKKNFIPHFLEKQRQKGIKVPSFDDFATALCEWSHSIADQRKIGGVGQTPNELFKEEINSLNPLPEKRWDTVNWKEVAVGSDWRVRYDNVWYSAPYTLIGKIIYICAGRETIRIFHEGLEVALHKRSFKKHDYVRNSLHAPPEQEEVLQCSRFGLLTQAENIGPMVLEVVEKLLNDPVHEDFRPARRVINLGKKYGKERLKKACERAVYFQNTSYVTIKSILVKELDQQNWKEEQINPRKEIFKFARTQNYFKEGVL